MLSSIQPLVTLFRQLLNTFLDVSMFELFQLHYSLMVVLKLPLMSKIKLLSAFLILAVYLIGCSKNGGRQQDNHAPIANAGNDTTIILPANTAILNASLSADPDNNIKSYQWTKI